MPKSSPDWSIGELKVLRSLWLNTLPPLNADPSNSYADNPRAAALGQRLFFDQRLSSNQRVSCASCHQPDRYFTDNLPVSRGISEVNRNAPGLLGAAYSPWFYWDGRRDSQWAQALVPLEEPAEHGSDRRQVLEIVSNDDFYHRSYLALFGSNPEQDAMQDDTLNRAYANIGKSIAAFQRNLMPEQSRFDYYVNELFGGPRQKEPLSKQEIAGLKLFISEQAQCTRCHNGPLFSNFGFHNIGLVELKRGVTEYDFGRKQAIPKVLQDPYNCLGDYSDANAADCHELRHIKSTGMELIGAFKVPILRNVAMTAPYMHDGRFESLREVIEHYRQAPVGRAGHQELNTIELDDAQIEQLVAFLETLTGPKPVVDKYQQVSARTLKREKNKDYKMQLQNREFEAIANRQKTPTKQSFSEYANWFGQTGLPESVERSLPKYLRQQFDQLAEDHDALKASELKYLGVRTDGQKEIHYWELPEEVMRQKYVYLYVDSEESVHIGTTDRPIPQ